MDFLFCQAASSSYDNVLITILLLINDMAKTVEFDEIS